jgi:thymidylate kinase
VKQTNEPTYGPAGAQVRLMRQGRLQIAPASQALLWVADRLDHLNREEGILYWLGKGYLVLSVHYSLYPYALLWEHVDHDWLWQINAYCRTADLTLFIDLPVSAESCALRANCLQVIDFLHERSEAIQTIDGLLQEEAYEATQRCIERLLGQKTLG